MTFFFFLVVIPFFALPDLVSLYLEMIESKRSKKYKHTYSNCPKNQKLPEVLYAICNMKLPMVGTLYAT